MLYCSLGTDTSENCRDIGNRANLGFLVAVFAWNDRLFIRKFLREDHLEAPHCVYLRETSSRALRASNIISCQGRV